MAIFKARLDSNYVIISNKTAQDNRLSFEARGVLAMLLSMPDDWSVNVAWIQKQSKAGRDKVNRIINELIECGYMRKDQPRNQQGKFTSQDYFVYPESDTAEEIPANGFPVNGLPVNGKTPTTKETVIQSTQDTNYDSSDEQSHPTELVEKAFHHFWKVWKQTKKDIGKVDTSPKESTFEKKWKPMFNKAYFKTHTIEQFKQEVSDICQFVVDAHNVEGFNRFENMQTGKFFNEKQWRDQ